MTDAELEELGALLAKATPGDWKLQHNGYGLSVYAFTGAIALGAADPHDSDNLALVAAMKRALPSLISTIRELREENAARDRVVEAARATKADLLARANMAEADHVELGVGVWSELVDSLAALEEQS